MSRASLRVKHQFCPVSTDLSNKLSVFGSLTSGGAADKDSDATDGTDATANTNGAANSGVLLINCKYS